MSVRFAIDTVAEDDRKNRNPSHDTERAVQRLTLAELSERDADDLAQRFRASRRDARPPVVKALDLIDAPRNTVANLIWPGLARAQREAGNRGALGMGRVTFSDALESMGVENRVARGLVGFVGDVALDPLTYLGGTGAAVRLGGKSATGASMAVSRTGRRVIKKSASEAASGGLNAVSHKYGRELFEQVGYTEERLARTVARAKRRRTDPTAAIQAVLLGSPNRPAAAKALRTAGFDQVNNRGLLQRLASNPVSAESGSAAVQRARGATDFIKRFQRGSTDLPGINLTRGAGAGSEVAHLPFTDFAVRVPAFTREGTERLANVARATAAVNPQAVARAAGTTESLTVARELDRVAADARSAQQRIREAESELAAGSPASAVIRPGEEYLDATDLRTPADVIAEERALLDELTDEIDTLRSQLNTIEAAPVQLTPEAGVAAGAVQAQAADMAALRAKAARASAIARQHKTMLDAKIATGAGDMSVREIRTAIGTERKRMVQEVKNLVHEAGEAVSADELARIDQRLDELRQQYAANQVSEHVDLIMASDADFKATEAMADAIHAGAEAASEAAIYAENPLLSLASLTDLERGAAMLARSAIGSDSITQGVMLISPMSRAFRSFNGLDEDSKVLQAVAASGRWRRQAFQNRGTSVHEIERMARAMSGPDARNLEQRIHTELANQVRKVMDTHKIDRKHFAAIDMVIAALQPKVLNEMLAGTPLERRGFNTSAFIGDEGVVAVNELGQGIDGAGNVVSAPWMREIENLGKDGALSSKVNPELMADLEALARKRVEDMIALGVEAKSAGLVDFLRPAYVPNIPTEELRKVIQAHGRHGPSSGATSGAQHAESVVAGFQKARTSDQTRFPMQLPDGSVEWRRFFEWERRYVNEARYENLDAIPGITDDTKTFIRNKQAEINAYDALPADEQFRYPPRNTDPFELNSMIESGRLTHITHGAELSRSGFETSSTLLAARRAAHHKIALAKHRLRETQQKYAVFVDYNVWDDNKNAPGLITLSNGAEARLIPGDTGIPTVLEIGGARYRPLSARTVIDGEKNFLFGQDATKAHPRRVALYPEQTAEFIERTQATLNDPTAMTGVLRAMEVINGAWKTATLFHPSWWFGNVGGNSILGSIALADHGVAPTAIIKNARPLAAIMRARGNPEKLREITLTVNGHQIQADELLEKMQTSGVIGPNKSNEVAVHFGLADQSVQASRSGLIAGIPDRIAQADNVVSESDRLSKAPKAAQRLAKTSIFGGKQAMAAIGTWFRANQATDDYMRALTYITLVDNGVPHSDAVSSTIRHLFDYNDLSTFENKQLRQVFPFYVWAKESLVHQINLVARNPIYAGLAPKSLHAIEEMIVGDAAVPDHMRPAWMRENLAVQLSSDPESRAAFTAGTMLPQEQLFRSLAGVAGLDGAQDFMNFMVSSTAAPIRVPLELGFGREVFTERTIGPSNQDADLSVIEHITGQVRPFREIGSPFSPRRGAIASAFSRGPAEGIGRALVGGRIQSLSDERNHFNLLRELKESEQNIRRAIRLAEREGDAGLSKRARVNLLHLYQDALNAGLEEAVPKWAQKQIREFGLVDLGSMYLPQIRDKVGQPAAST